MSPSGESHRSIIAACVYSLLNPIPFGCFVAALIFDIIYSKSAGILWDKAAAWLIVFGLLFAVVPRLINLTWLWLTSRKTATRADQYDFWFNLLAIVAAIFNAFVHSRDAYAVVPAGALLSSCTVVLMSVGHIVTAAERVRQGEVHV
jgi:uncharacterized membrane protein